MRLGRLTQLFRKDRCMHHMQ
ncbi:unnamed protein product [Spirodela intermedia]|uniref:Uncharacterized protein n=1 Tax=Spirodela intermedia TaxID=51605 RepID=A0A7I8I8Y3_SPIIN|nr:unnamed protein product [Spirodela intermedia]CAA6654115.1 unnamed protein product [Spirodela intermedia]